MNWPHIKRGASWSRVFRVQVDGVDVLAAGDVVTVSLLNIAGAALPSQPTVTVAGATRLFSLSDAETAALTAGMARIKITVVYADPALAVNGRPGRDASPLAEIEVMD